MRRKSNRELPRMPFSEKSKQRKKLPSSRGKRRNSMRL
jgi:hypothetical protein